MKHELKTLPGYFKRSWIGDKTFEIRKNDRNFQEGDEVVLMEWEPQVTQDTSDNPGEPFAGEYTGREIEGFIRYVTDYEQKPGYVVFRIEFTERRE